MKKRLKQLLVLILSITMIGTLMACSNKESSETKGSVTEAPANDVDEDTSASSSNGGLIEAITPEKLGSGDVKWSEEETADGWLKVTNAGGETLGYSKESGISLIQVDGFAFKDMNKNGMLDGYEDWRLDDKARANDLAAHMTGEEIAPLLTHGGWTSFGTSLDESDTTYINNGGRGGVTRSAGSNGNTSMAVSWNNMLQATCEKTGNYGIPATISIDPNHISGLIDQVSLAATMDTGLAHDVAVEMSKQYRRVGITMLLGPQIDIATSPIWCRTGGSYSEDPALNRDLASAFIDGLQSTYNADGQDLGWGQDSIVAIAKHYAGAGASEGGRNDHFDGGKYTVFPGGNFAAHLVPFFDGAFKLTGKTAVAGGLMPNYAISYSTDGSLGDLVGGAYSSFKINLLRDNGYDGFILTDWQITEDAEGSFGSRAFGADVEKMTIPERFARLFELGVDQVGGTSDTASAVEAYSIMVTDMGEDAALAKMREAAIRFFLTQMQVGLFENPYVTTDGAMSSAWSEASMAYGQATQEKSVVMIKNSDNAIHKIDESAGKPTVYVPYAFKTKGNVFFGGISYSWEPAMNIESLSQYYNVVTDTLGEPSGEPDDKGNPTYTKDDIIRASAADIAKCDYAIVHMTAPSTDSAKGEDGSWTPASIQYSPYTANSTAVRKETIAGDIIVEEKSDGYYGKVSQETKENRSYYGNTATASSNYADLELLQYVSGVVSNDCKVVVVMKSKQPMVWSEVEPLADAILVYYAEDDFGTGKSWFSDETLAKVIAGVVEPSGLLPLQQPASMEAVEAQNEDVPRDVECYVDSNDNTYDFAYGLNWSGVIKDDRVSKYSAAPLTTPESISYSNAN
ncbi:MAG TPA: glycoside hydrolase family 3 protein [Clostridiales bacterium]|nr:glycoside hydrolase family 3 protein [Clostridiales bacterium]